MSAQLSDSFPERLKTTKQKIIHINNRRPFHEEKSHIKL